MLRGMIKRTKSFCLTLCFIMALLPAAELYAGTLGSGGEASLYDAGSSGEDASGSSDIVMYLGEKLTIKPISGNGRAKWTSDDKKTVKVGKKNGKATARKVGGTNIRAVFDSGITEVFHITVKEAELDKPELMTEPGSTGTIKLNGGKIKKVKSSDESVITITKDGTFSAGSVGDAEITIKGKPKKGKKKDYICKVYVRNSYTVTFESNGGSTVPSRKVFDGMTVEKPADPVKDGFDFGGWHKDSELKERFDFNEKITGNLTLYALWLREKGGTESGNEPENGDPENGDPENGENGENGGAELNSDEMVSGGSGANPEVKTYTITDLQVDPVQMKAIARVSSSSDSILKVRFIEEEVFFADEYPSNKEYIDENNLYAESRIDENTDYKIITADITGDLPGHFVAEAVLINERGEELCNSCIDIEHTVRHEQFSAKTIDDFENKDLVLNFDEQKDDNFGVLAEGVKIITTESSNAVYGENEDGKKEIVSYSLVNPSEAVSPGDRVYVKNDRGGYLFRVKEIKKEGNVTTVIPAEANDPIYGYEFSDFYQFMKVHMDGGDEDEEILSSLSDDESVILRSEKAHGNVTVKIPPAKIPFGEIGGASLDGSITIKVTVEYDFHLFGDKYLDMEFRLIAQLSAKAELGVKGEFKKEVLLDFIPIPIPAVPGLEVFIETSYIINVNASAKAVLEGKIVVTLGFDFCTKAKKMLTPICKADSNYSFSAQGSLTITTGPAFSSGIDFLRLVGVGDQIFVGGKANATATYTFVEGGSYKHACDLCCDFTVSMVVEPTIEFVSVLLPKDNKSDPLISYEVKLFTGYFSVINDADSNFEGKYHIGIGEEKEVLTCPNRKYKVNFITKDARDNIVSAPITIWDKTKSASRGSTKGGESVYLACKIRNDPPHKAPSERHMYVATATINGKKVEKEFEVDDREITVELKENESDPDDSGGGSTSGTGSGGGGSTSGNESGGGSESESSNSAEYSVTLSWPESIDLDLMVEFSEPGQTEYDDSSKIYFNHKSAKYKDGTSAGSLNGDSRSAGSETIKFTARENTMYVCYVKISDPMNADISGYSPSLTVKKDGKNMGSFSVPSGSGNYWDVFLIEDGVFRELGDINYEEDTDSGK